MVFEWGLKVSKKKEIRGPFMDLDVCVFCFVLFFFQTRISSWKRRS